MTQQLPHSPEAEEALVAVLLEDPAQIAVVSAQLAPEDLYVPAWRDTYRAMLEISQRGDVVDLAILTREMGEKPPVNLLGLSPAHRAPAEDYARAIRGDAFRRRLISALDAVTRKAYTTDDRSTLLASLQDAVAAVTAGADAGRLISPAQAVDQYLEVIRQRAAGRPEGLTWGFPELDAFMKNADGGEMIVLAARPSVGKTAMAEQIADHWAEESGQPVLFCSLEMSLTQLLDRSVTRYYGRKIPRGTLMAEFHEPAEARRNVKVWYLDDPFATTSDVRSAAARIKLLSGGLAGIVVDYISLLKDPGESEVQRVTRISRNIKAIAREYDVPVLALSQLSRGLMQRTDHHPQLHDLRESGAIEQDADIVLGLHREPLSNPVLDVEVLKNRHGQTRMLQLRFDGDAMRIS